MHFCTVQFASFAIKPCVCAPMKIKCPLVDEIEGGRATPEFGEGTKKIKKGADLVTKLR